MARGSCSIFQVPRCSAMATAWYLMTGQLCVSPASPNRCLKSSQGAKATSRGSPGISATVTRTCKLWARDCASGATTCSKTCCAALARGRSSSRHRSTPNPAPTCMPMPRRARADGQQAEPPAQQNEAAEAPVGSPALYRLLTWLSPSYPVGAFAYSSGIEWAVEAGDVRDAETLKDWLATMLSDGGGFCDAVFFVHAHGAA